MNPEFGPFQNIRKHWRSYLLVLVGGFLLNECFDSENLEKFGPSTQPCIVPAVLPYEYQSFQEFDSYERLLFEDWLAAEFLPLINIYGKEDLSTDNFGVIYDVTPLVSSEVDCKGVPQEFYDTENPHWAITYEFLHKKDGGPHTIGVILFDRIKVSLSEQFTDLLADFIDKMKERSGDIEILRLVVEIDPTTKQIQIKGIAIKQHDNGFIQFFDPRYLDCPGNGHRLQVMQTIGKNTIHPGEEICERANVGGIDGIIEGSGDTCEGDEIVDWRENINPLHNIERGDPFESGSPAIEAFEGNSIDAHDFEGNRNPEHGFCEVK